MSLFLLSCCRCIADAAIIYYVFFPLQLATSKRLTPFSLPLSVAGSVSLIPFVCLFLSLLCPASKRSNYASRNLNYEYVMYCNSNTNFLPTDIFFPCSDGRSDRASFSSRLLKSSSSSHPGSERVDRTDAEEGRPAPSLLRLSKKRMMTMTILSLTAAGGAKASVGRCVWQAGRCSLPRSQLRSFDFSLQAGVRIVDPAATRRDAPRRPIQW